MECEDCGQPATFHQAVMVAGSKREMHLCRGCAEKRNLISQDQVNLVAIVKKYVGNAPFVASALHKIQCPDCGIKYMDFRNKGRLGCPYDYVVFRAGLLPLLDRVQRATHHKGKRPRWSRSHVEAPNVLRHLRHQLKLAVNGDDFEEAARLRDLIQTEEARHEP